MPSGDGTGPGGMGPMSGRGAGFCAGFPRPGYASAPGGGRFAGWGRGGGGRGWRHRFFATGLTGPQRAGVGFAPEPPSDSQQLDALRNQAAHFQDALEDIRKRIDEMQDRKDTD